MSCETWVIFGATSMIAKEFAHLAAQSGHNLRLVGRNKEELLIIETDIRLRYQVECDCIVLDLSQNDINLEFLTTPTDNELNLFIAHSVFTVNNHLNTLTISELIHVNILSTVQIINAYLNRDQTKHQLIYLSSVAGCRGRAKNSLYGASKAAIEVYLEGLQQAAPLNQQISIARLGFIDTKQTYGQSGIFYAAPPKACAKACWNALKKRKRLFYYPFFWQWIMTIITTIPFVIYKKLKI